MKIKHNESKFSGEFAAKNNGEEFYYDYDKDFGLYNMTSMVYLECIKEYVRINLFHDQEDKLREILVEETDKFLEELNKVVDEYNFDKDFL